MRYPDKSTSLLSLMIPFAIAIFALCVTAGYSIYHYARERAYRERWKDYNDCGIA